MSFLQTYLCLPASLAALLILLPCQHCCTHRLSLHNIFTEIIRYLGLRLYSSCRKTSSPRARGRSFSDRFSKAGRLLGRDVAGRENVVNPWLTTTGSSPDVRHRGSNGWMKGESDGEIACVSHVVVVNPSRLGGAGAARALRGASRFSWHLTAQAKKKRLAVTWPMRCKKVEIYPTVTPPRCLGYLVLPLNSAYLTRPIAPLFPFSFSSFVL